MAVWHQVGLVHQQSRVIEGIKPWLGLHAEDEKGLSTSSSQADAGHQCSGIAGKYVQQPVLIALKAG